MSPNRTSGQPAFAGLEKPPTTNRRHQGEDRKYQQHHGEGGDQETDREREQRQGDVEEENGDGVDLADPVDDSIRKHEVRSGGDWVSDSERYSTTFGVRMRGPKT